MPGKPPAGQRTVRCHRNIIFRAQPGHFPLFLPEDQIIVPLNGDKFGKSFSLCQCVGFGKLIGKTVGNADVTNLSLLHHTVQPVHNIIKGRLIVPHMINIKVYIIKPQILQTGIDHLFNVLLSGDTGSDFILGTGQKLCCHHHIFPPGEISQRTAKILFAGAALISDGCIEKVHSQLQPPPDHRPGMFFIQCPAVLAISGISKAHASHADAGNCKIRIA